MKVALFQYPISSFPEQTKTTVFKKLKQKNLKGIDLIVCPEMWMGSVSPAVSKEELVLFYKDLLSEVKNFCKTKKVALNFSQLEKEKNLFFNTSYFITSSGKVLKTYRKIHLFEYQKEHKQVSAGQDDAAFSFQKFKIGLSICYDLRFPELFRRLLQKNGVNVILNGAQWPSSRREHWLTLLRARAIENQCYVIGVNRLGEKDGLHYSGDSVVFDPWGECVIHLDSKKEWGVVGIELSHLKKIRKKFPFLKSIRM